MVEETGALPNLTKTSGRTSARVAGLLLLVLVVLAILAGLLPRLRHTAALATDVKSLETERQPVHVAPVQAGETQTEVQLPGNTQAIVEAPVYARTSGFIKRRFADIGDKVRAGAILAEIDAPELDQELAQAQAAAAHSAAALGQAKASLVQAQARMTLAKETLDRWSVLATRGVVSKQERDEKQGDYDADVAQVDALKSNIVAAEADVAAQNANVHRIQDLESFKQVRAPFDGVITVRNIDVGNLIAGGGNSPQQELYHIARTDELRIMVSVPQTYSPMIHVGEQTIVRVTELGQREFPGKIARTADSLDPNSRTLLTEIHIPNATHVLFPGMFTTVVFRLPGTVKALIVPADALIVDARGTQLAVVGNGNAVHFKHVNLGRDFGATVEVLNGIQLGDRVIVNPPDSLSEGSKVDVLKK